MKYKLILMFILSILAHITIAGALVYVPYQITMQNQESLGGEVIWGKIFKTEGRRQKAEGRSKNIEARNKKQEARSEKLEVRSGEQEIRVDNSGDGEGIKEDENSSILRQAQDDNHCVMEPCHSELVELLLNHDGQRSRNTVFSGDSNINSGYEGRVLLAASAGGESHTDEGDEVKNAEKHRLYNDQLKALIEQVKVEIEKNKYYPFIAKLKGIEGTVYVNFLIGQDGKPQSIEMLKSSGSEVLDNSAIKTIKNLKPFRNINPELRELDITVPITYRLKEDR